MKVSHGVNTDCQDSTYTGVTEVSIKIFYRVHTKLECGFLEKVCENGMMREYKKGFSQECVGFQMVSSCKISGVSSYV